MYKILVAEDENIERKVLLKKLRTKYDGAALFYEAENGREALRKYREEAVKILILDIEMPGVTGLQAAAEIRKEDKDAVIIFLTAYDEFSYAKKAVSVHALDYLLKPYDEKELFLSVDTAMHYVDEIDQGKRRPLPVSGEETVIEEIKEPAKAGASFENASIINGQKLMMEYVEKNYMEDISVQDIAKALNYSEAYFCKLFKQHFGTNFVSFLSEYRISRAKELLSKTYVNIKDIGRSVGYPDSNYFAKVFKRITGKSPSEYRAEILDPH
ncbi:response regulator (CheY-like receiver domain and AraC-type DNA-binding domain-containing protein) [Lachnospiraceae bacterium JC7]|nr:response regulator (CheY-like receiver domain and AraC-type DNA-binding domain-containing protein) [Lachnospiraceae bacterium JC7]